MYYQKLLSRIDLLFGLYETGQVDIESAMNLLAEAEEAIIRMLGETSR